MLKYSFILGGLIAAIGWVIAWPEEQSPPIASSPQAARSFRHDSRTPEQLSRLVDRLKNSSDRAAQVSAARELAGCRRSEIHELLLSMRGEFGDVWNFPEAAKLLLVELARRDPAGALDWCWENLREERGWPHAYNQIGPQWAWDDPEGFSQYVKQHLKEVLDGEDLTMKELLASSEPILSRDNTNDAQLWLVKSAPRLAFQLIRFSGTQARQDLMMEALNSEGDFASALGAWDDYDPRKEGEAQDAYELARRESKEDPDSASLKKISNDLHGKLRKVWHPSQEATVREICKLWKARDEEGFSKSPYVGWDQKVN